MASALEVAHYFLSVQTPESDITNLKLQKLCAYAQALSLSLLDTPLFEEELEAWTHGPVIPEIYYEYEKYGRRPIPSTGLSERCARMPFSDEQKYVLETVGSYYGQYSAWALRALLYSASTSPRVTTASTQHGLCGSARIAISQATSAVK